MTLGTACASARLSGMEVVRVGFVSTGLEGVRPDDAVGTANSR